VSQKNGLSCGEEGDWNGSEEVCIKFLEFHIGDTSIKPMDDTQHVGGSNNLLQTFLQCAVRIPRRLRTGYVLYGRCLSHLLSSDAILAGPLVGYVDVTIQPENIQNDEPQNFVSKLDRTNCVQMTEWVNGVKPCLGTRSSYCAFDHTFNPHLLMKQGLDSLGSGSSTISLSIVRRNSATITYHLRVGYVEVILGTLLTKMRRQ